MVAEGRLSRVKLRMSGLGLTLSCSDQTSIHADVQHGVILQLSLDALLVYAHVCAGAKAAANRRKLAVASSIGLCLPYRLRSNFAILSPCLPCRRSGGGGAVWMIAPPF